MSICDMVKKMLLKKGTFSSNKVDVHSMKCSDCNAASTFMTKTRSNENNTDLQSGMANKEGKIEQKINVAKQEIIDLMNKKFDEIRS